MYFTSCYDSYNRMATKLYGISVMYFVYLQETVYHCIQQGSDSNAKDNAGWTPLHEACSRGHSDVVRVLVKYNADVNACSNDGIRYYYTVFNDSILDIMNV